jgi:hypothetical protein
VSYSVTRWWGKEQRGLPAAEFAAVVAELDAADDEHGFVSLTHESEWTLSYSKSRVLVFENVERDDEPNHMADVSAASVVRLWRHLASGDIAAVLAEEWQPGYGGAG